MRKAFLVLSMSAMLGMAVIGPTAALAQLGPPFGPPPGLGGLPPGPGGPPPGVGGPPAGPGEPPPGLGGAGPGPHQARLGAPPPRPGADAPRLSRVEGPAGGRGFQGNARALELRTAGYAYGRAYSHSAYGHDDWRYRYRPYGIYAYRSSYASSDDGCYYSSTYRRGGYQRVLVCTHD